MTRDNQQYHFDSFGPGMRDAIVYFHRDFSKEELKAVQEILSPLLHQTDPSTTAQIWLVEHDFSKALETLKVQINQELSRGKRPRGGEAK